MKGEVWVVLVVVELDRDIREVDSRIVVVVGVIGVTIWGRESSSDSTRGQRDRQHKVIEVLHQ